MDAHAINELIEQLSNPDAVERHSSRLQLVEVGQPAVNSLVLLLSAELPHVRWEAAKTLGGIADPMAAPHLVAALADDDVDVRWVAGEALIALGRDALEPLLEGLIETRDASWMFDGAHHVLHGLAKHDLQPVLQPLLDAFRRSEPQVTVPVEAEKLLESLRAL